MKLTRFRGPSQVQADGSHGVTVHGLRHACGSLLIALGAKPKLVQAVLRHAKLSTTMDLYVSAYDEDVRGAVNVLDRALA